MPTIKDVPDEVLELVFSKLPLPIRKVTRLVCKKWLAVCNSASMTKNEVLKLDVQELHQLKIPRGHFNIEVECHRYYRLSGETLKAEQEFWILHGKSVRSLILYSYDLSWPTLYDSINQCTNMTDFSLACSNLKSLNDDTANAIMKGLCAKLDSLLRLTISGDPKTSMTRGDFVRLTAEIPKLKRIQIENIYVNEKTEIEAIPAILKQLCTLNEIALFQCEFVTDTFLENLVDQLGPQLIGLYLGDFSLNSINCLSQQSKNLPNIQNLELSNISLTKGDFLPVLLRFKNLKLISLSEDKLTDNELEALVELEHLKGLDLEKIQCSVNGILKAFGQKVNRTLSDLRLRNLECLTDDVLSNILPHLPNLKRLDLSHCSEITTKGIMQVSGSCEQLVHLALENCYNIKSLIQPPSINCLVNLIHLNLFDCHGLRRNNIPNLRLKKLKTIELVDVSVPEKGFKKLLKQCPNLTRVHLGDYYFDDDAHRYDIVEETGIFTFDEDSIDRGTIFNFSDHV